jgi:hypothetical protein
MEVTMAVQLDLPLEKSSPPRRTYYSAWARSGMQLPYDPKTRERAISIWLRNLSDTLHAAQHTKSHA